MMLATLIATVLASNLVKPPKQPEFNLGSMWRVVDLRDANEMKIQSEFYKDMPRWVRLYGVDLPKTNERGYSGAREDLELLLGREPDIYFEDEGKDLISRNAYYLQYIWTRGKLIQFELVRDGWAKVNDEGRKGRYAKFLIGAEEEAKRFHEGRWAQQSP